MNATVETAEGGAQRRHCQSRLHEKDRVRRLSSIDAEEHEKLRSEIPLKNQQARFLTVSLQASAYRAEEFSSLIKRLGSLCDILVYVVPITHSRPDPGTAVELPSSVKRRLGLDASASWIVTSELNRFVWPGYDLRPISRNSPDVFSWGYLPVELLEAVKLQVVAHQRAKRLGVVDRS